GDQPATSARTEPGGDPAFVPPYDTRLIVDPDFTADRPLIPAGTPTRDKGWRAAPVANAPGDRAPLSVLREQITKQASFITIGTGAQGPLPKAGSRALLAQ